MKVESLDLVTIGVKDHAKALKEYERIFGTKWYTFDPSKATALSMDLTDPNDVMYNGQVVMSMNRGPLELMKLPNVPEIKDGVATLWFKVTDLKETKKELEQKGLRQRFELVMGDVTAVLYYPDSTFGVNLGFYEYVAPTCFDACGAKAFGEE